MLRPKGEEDDGCVEKSPQRPTVMEGGTKPAPTHRLNVLGFHCPVPVMKTKEALLGLNKGDVLEVLADDPETRFDMPMVLGRTPHHLLEMQEQHGEFRFLIEVNP